MLEETLRLVWCYCMLLKYWFMQYGFLRVSEKLDHGLWALSDFRCPKFL